MCERTVPETTQYLGFFRHDCHFLEERGGGGMNELLSNIVAVFPRTKISTVFRRELASVLCSRVFIQLRLRGRDLNKFAGLVNLIS